MPKEGNTRSPGFQNAPATPKYQNGNNYLLVIGIDRYTHLPRLYNAVKDAQEIMAVLLEKYHFTLDYTITLYNDQATKRNIYKQLKTLATRVNAKNHDNVIIYFSGHGEYDTINNEGYWIPVEAENGEDADYISNSDIRKKLSAIKSHHTFLIADSCFAGSLFAKGPGKNVSKRYERDPSRWGLTAGRNEIVSDGKPGDNSPFAESLLYRLRTNRESLKVQDLCSYVLEQVLGISDQTPIGEPLRIEGHRSGQFVFHLKEVEQLSWKEAQNQTLELGKKKEEPQDLSVFPKVKGSSSYLDRYGKFLFLLLVPMLLFLYSKKGASPSNEVIDYIEFTDSRDGQTYNSIQLEDGNIWMAENLNFETRTGSFCFGEEKRSCDSLGRLYTFEAVKNACPDGWDIPRDDEWKNLLKIYGGYYDLTTRKEIQNPQKSYNSLIDNGKNEFAITLSGMRDTDGAFLVKDTMGYYWSEIIEEEKRGSYYFFNVFGDDVAHNYLMQDTISAMSCRCIKRLENKDMPHLELSYKWGKDKIIASLKGGQKPYTLNLKKNSNVKYTASIKEEGEHTILIKKSFREDAGDYQLIVKDAIGKEQSKSLTIDKSKPVIKYGSFIDSRDNRRYQTILLKDGKTWMAENLKYLTLNSWCYDDKDFYCESYGRLYTWAAAKKACPPGWHLPSEQEWRKMTKKYGGTDDDAPDEGQASYNNLISGGYSDFTALLGGGRLSHGEFYDLGNYGAYWSGTEGSQSEAWSYDFDEGSLYRNYNSKDVGRSCRCIQN